MPLYHPNIRFSDCWSSVGNITFYHRNGKCYWRTKPTPTFPGTLWQQEHQAVHFRALEAWRSLEHQVQKQWSAYARDVTAHRPPFLKENHISGYNLFVSPSLFPHRLPGIPTWCCGFLFLSGMPATRCGTGPWERSSWLRPVGDAIPGSCAIFCRLRFRRICKIPGTFCSSSRTTGPSGTWTCRRTPCTCVTCSLIP